MPERLLSQRLRETAPELYLATLYAPEESRQHLVALYAFHAEIGQIEAKVREPAAGEIRLQWWREVLERKREHGGDPLAAAVLATISARSLPVSALTDYLQARLFDLYHDPMPDLETFETYGGETESAILRLACMCLQPDWPQGNKEIALACGHGGLARLCAMILSRVDIHRRKRRCYIPLSMLASMGLPAEEWLSSQPDDRHRNAISAMAGLGLDHYRQARGAVERIPRGFLPAFLPLAPLPRLLRGFQRYPGRAFTGVSIQPSQLALQWAFARSALFGLPQS